MYTYVNYWDFLLAPIYIYIFYRIVSRISQKKYSYDLYIQKKFIQGFWVKIAASICYVLFIQYYFGGGDTFMYFGYGRVMHNAIINDASNVSFLFSDKDSFFDYVQTITFEEAETTTGYMASLSNQMVVRFSCIFGFLSFQNYTITSLFFSMLSYIGIWRMYLFFINYFKQYKKEISFSFLFLPSFVFWGSGVLKESICLFAMGVLINTGFKIIYKKKVTVLNLFLVVFCTYLLVVIKSYIFYAIIIAFVISFAYHFMKNFNLFLKIFLGIFAVILLVFSANVILESIISSAANTDNIENVIETAKVNKNNYEDLGGSFVDIGNFDASISGVITKIPNALVNVFFRPFLWEATSPILFISMLEAMFFLLLFLRVLIKTKIIFFVKNLAQEPIYIFSFVFVLFLGIIVGFTTYNFGTILRYKIPCMPFLAMMLLLLNKSVNTTPIHSVPIADKH